MVGIGDTLGTAVVLIDDALFVSTDIVRMRVGSVDASIGWYKSYVENCEIDAGVPGAILVSIGFDRRNLRHPLSTVLM